MHKKIALVAAAFFCFISFCAYSNKLTANAQTQAKGEIAMELTTGKVLSENNADDVLPMASTTKIMTAILVIEDCNLDTVVKVPDECIGTEGSSIYLKYGEEISIKDLLYGLMLRSGNDSAIALSIIHSGTTEKFVDAMNKKAKQIGANNTNFTNPSGLPDNNHFTTARDLCNIARYAMQNPIFSQIVSAKNYNGEFRSFTNKNKMLALCKGANGIKTGYTIKAGRCLVSSVKRGNMDVVCVVLSCPDTYGRSIEIIEECFKKYELVTINADKRFLCENTVCALNKDYNFVVEKDCALEYKIEPYKKLKNCDKSEPIAKLNILAKNCLLFSENLYTIL